MAVRKFDNDEDDENEDSCVAANSRNIVEEVRKLQRTIYGEHGDNGLRRTIKRHERRLDNLDKWMVRASAVVIVASVLAAIVSVFADLGVFGK